jgi:hypothetical protein
MKNGYAVHRGWGCANSSFFIPNSSFIFGCTNSSFLIPHCMYESPDLAGRYVGCLCSVAFPVHGYAGARELSVSADARGGTGVRDVERGARGRGAAPAGAPHRQQLVSPPARFLLSDSFRWLPVRRLWGSEGFYLASYDHKRPRLAAVLRALVPGPTLLHIRFLPRTPPASPRVVPLRVSPAEYRLLTAQMEASF